MADDNGIWRDPIQQAALDRAIGNNTGPRANEYHVQQTFDQQYNGNQQAAERALHATSNFGACPAPGYSGGSARALGSGSVSGSHVTTVSLGSHHHYIERSEFDWDGLLRWGGWGVALFLAFGFAAVLIKEGGFETAAGPDVAGSVIGLSLAIAFWMTGSLKGAARVILFATSGIVLCCLVSLLRPDTTHAVGFPALVCLCTVGIGLSILFWRVFTSEWTWPVVKRVMGWGSVALLGLGIAHFVMPNGLYVVAPNWINNQLAKARTQLRGSERPQPIGEGARAASRDRTPMTRGPLASEVSVKPHLAFRMLPGATITRDEKADDNYVIYRIAPPQAPAGYHSELRYPEGLSGCRQWATSREGWSATQANNFIHIEGRCLGHLFALPAAPLRPNLACALDFRREGVLKVNDCMVDGVRVAAISFGTTSFPYSNTAIAVLK